MSTDEAFITHRAGPTHSTTSIRGGLIFYPGTYIRTGEVHEDPPGVSLDVRDNTFYAAAPRWYQLRQWWKLIQLLRTFAPPT
jgi:hypothetical protein